MNWHSFIAGLLGGLLPLNAIILTNVLELRKRKRTHDELLHALLQGLQDEIGGLLEMIETSPVQSIHAVPKGKPYEGLFIASQDYFIVYHANAGLIMQIADANLRRNIIQTYTRAKAMLDTMNMNRLYLERYRYLRSTFLKTNDASVQAESEDYHRVLIQIAGQLKHTDAEFRRTATGLLEMLPKNIESGTGGKENILCRKTASIPLPIVKTPVET